MYTIKNLKEKIAELEDTMLICFLDFEADEITYMKSGQASIGDMYIYKIGNQKVFSQYEDAFDVESEVKQVFYITQG